MSKLRKILLIDDDRQQQHLMQGLVTSFRSGPFELESAATYELGLKKLLSGKYAVCLLDYRLDEDGKKIKRRGAAVLITAPE